jgi:hypothetical protein
MPVEQRLAIEGFTPETTEPEAFGPFAQHGSLEGAVVRVGGLDETAGFRGQLTNLTLPASKGFRGQLTNLTLPASKHLPIPRYGRRGFGDSLRI